MSESNLPFIPDYVKQTLTLTDLKSQAVFILSAVCLVEDVMMSGSTVTLPDTVID